MYMSGILRSAEHSGKHVSHYCVVYAGESTQHLSKCSPDSYYNTSISYGHIISDVSREVYTFVKSSCFVLNISIVLTQISVKQR